MDQNSEGEREREGERDLPWLVREESDGESMRPERQQLASMVARSRLSWI
jgi:hypothetical protein